MVWFVIGKYLKRTIEIKFLKLKVEYAILSKGTAEENL